MKKISKKEIDTEKKKSLYIIEFIIGFILAGIGIFVILTAYFCVVMSHLYCFLFPAYYIFMGMGLSAIALSIGVALIIDGYSRFKRIRMIQIKVRNHVPLESVPEKVSGKKSCIYCCLIYIIGIIVVYLLYFLILYLKIH